MVLPQGQAGGVNGAEGIFVYAGQLEPASGQNHFSTQQGPLPSTKEKMYPEYELELLDVNNRQYFGMLHAAFLLRMLAGAR